VEICLEGPTAEIVVVYPSDGRQRKQTAATLTQARAIQAGARRAGALPAAARADAARELLDHDTCAAALFASCDSRGLAVADQVILRRGRGTRVEATSR
jgi:hypothetical protein